MIIEIDLSAELPLYMQIEKAIRRALIAGELKPGERLPAGRDLAAALDVNLETVQRAYRRLADDGIVISRVGRGTRVAEDLDLTSMDVRDLISQLVARARDAGVDDETLLSEVRGQLADAQKG